MMPHHLLRDPRAWSRLRRALFEYHQEPTQPDAWQHYERQRREDEDPNPSGEVFPERNITMPREPHLQVVARRRVSPRQLLHDQILGEGLWQERVRGPRQDQMLGLGLDDEQYLGDTDPDLDEGQVIPRPSSSNGRQAARPWSEGDGDGDGDDDDDEAEAAARRRPSKFQDYKKYRDYWRKNRSKYREKLRQQRMRYRRDKNKIKRQRERRRNLPKGRHRPAKPMT